MSKHYYYSLSADHFHSPHQRNGQVKVQDYLIPLRIDWQIKRSPACLIAHHKIIPLLTHLPHGMGMMLKEAYFCLKNNRLLKTRGGEALIKV
ncbi:hypothetical protein [Nostoc commune]|uniref:hypothetical protein n=1 Tax=Nostoc commune TaxID=1178 RepID=UPI00207353E7|nr:hypothetical protein [Nostoc commune]